MSSTQTFTSQAYHGYSSEYDKGPKIIVDLDNTSVFSADYTASSDNSWVTVNSTGKGKLFPNATAHPTKADITFYAGKFGLSSGEIRFYVNGTQIFNQSVGNKNYAYTGRTDAVILNSTKSTEIKWVIAHGTLTGVSINDINVTYYFTRYDFSASTSTGIASATVSRDNGYDGDSVTFTASVQSGYNFDGWYNGTTKVSSSQTYVHTVSGADLSLTAKAIASTKRLTVTYGGNTIVDTQVTPPVGITYDNTQIASVSSGQTKTLNCGNKLMSSNVIISAGGGTLLCSGKIMETNIVVVVS